MCVEISVYTHLCILTYICLHEWVLSFTYLSECLGLSLCAALRHFTSSSSGTIVTLDSQTGMLCV